MPTHGDALFAEHRQQLFRYLCRAVGDADTARDLTQDVFLRVIRTTVPDDTPAGVRAWLFRIARNLALDYHRRRQRTPEIGTLGLAGSQAASQDVALAVNEALATLSDLDRDVFLLREMGGLGYAEIAHLCDTTPDGVRSRIHRARLQLRAHLSEPIARQRRTPLRQSHRSHEA